MQGGGRRKSSIQVLLQCGAGLFIRREGGRQSDWLSAMTLAHPVMSPGQLVQLFKPSRSPAAFPGQDFQSIPDSGTSPLLTRMWAVAQEGGCAGLQGVRNALPVPEPRGQGGRLRSSLTAQVCRGQGPTLCSTEVSRVPWETTPREVCDRSSPR